MARRALNLLVVQPIGPDTAVCPACGSLGTVLLRARDTNRNVTSESFPYFRCGACRLVFMAPVPNDLGSFYPNNYHGRVHGIDALSAAAERERYKIEMVQEHASGGRLLEVGGSWGSFALLAKRAGFEVTELEMNPDCCRFLETVVGVSVIESTDIEGSIGGQTFDVVALWHVVEHLANPWSAIKALAEAVPQGGIMVVATPNPEALQFRLLRSRWTHIDAPRHTVLIPWRVLQRQLADCGLSLRSVTTTDDGSLAYDSFGWAMSLSHLGGSAPVARTLHFIGRVIAWMMRPLERRRGRGSCYTAIFVRDGAA